MKKFVAIILVQLILLGTVSSAYPNEKSSNHNKLSQYLMDYIEFLEPDDIIDVYVVLYDIDCYNVMQSFEANYPDAYYEYCSSKEYDNRKTKRSIVDIDKTLNESITNDSKNGDLLQQAIEYKRMVFADAYLNYNNEFINRNNIEDVLFISKYAPLLVVSVTKDKLFSFKKDEDVFVIDLFVDLIAEEDLSLANEMSGAEYVRDTLGYKGSGVKIGQVEPCLPETTDSDLAGVNITCYGVLHSDHATRVARILVGQSNGIAPQAMLYSASMKGPISFYEAVEWLITQGVNIINMSASLTTPQGNDTASPEGRYETCSKWVDHIAVQHDVHFVKSAGNRGVDSDGNPGDHYITCPGMAFNAITVGGFDDHNNQDVTDDSISLLSSYREKTASGDRPEKPNLVASATNIFIGSDESGTSFAAPQVAGVIAQLCSYNPSLKTKQTIIGAVLAASSTCKITGTNSGYTNGIFQNDCINGQISKIEGAGKLNARAARTLIKNGNYWKETIQAEDFPFTKNVYIDSNNNSLMRVAIFWLKRNSLSSSDHTIINTSQIDSANLNITVYAPNGTVVGSSSSIKSNYEIVQFQPTQTGAYRIVITKANNNYSSKEYVGIAVW